MARSASRDGATIIIRALSLNGSLDAAAKAKKGAVTAGYSETKELARKTRSSSLATR